MKRHAILASLVLSTLLAGCQKAAPQFTAQDAAAVRGLFDSVVVDIQAGNWDAWANRFAADAVFHRSNGPALVGRAAILAWGKSLPPVETFSFSNVEVNGEGNLAYGMSSIPLKFRDLPADTSKQLVVLRRDVNGRWLLQAVSVTSDLPLPQPTAARRT